MSILSALIGPATELAGKFIQDKDQAARLAHDLSTMADKHSQQAMLAQIEVNKAEAASAFAYHFVLQPFIVFVVAAAGIAIPELPSFDMGSLMTVMMGMLGLGGLRSYEKKQGLTK